MKKMLFVYNPNAGKGEIRIHLSDIIEMFSGKGYSVNIFATSGSGDARDCVTKNGSEYDLIVCCGGDGTLNEVTDGLMALGSPPPCGYIPAGTTNDFAKSFQLPADMVEAAKVVDYGTPFKYDIGELNGDYFDYVAAFGAFAEVPYVTTQTAKNLFGKLAYFLEGVKHLTSIKNYDIEVYIGDEVIRENVIYGMVTNSFSVGGFLSLYKEEAKLDDGLLEAFFIRSPKNILELQTIVSSLLTGDISCRFFVYRQISEMKMISDKPVSWTVDGEFGGSFSESVIRNHSKAVQFIRREM